ncbi:ferredoxin [Streptomyces sp. NBC_00820]|uniref:ferredoxin n=1 Tax=Streptomyces sp. NBC_00820 TaxID=2975842 RepID=UPI002ED494DB|nr:ferredoxin [Streptomyces sp. NBC_00820]
MTPPTSEQQLYRFLEDRFTCAQACSECARACAVRVSLLDPDGTERLDRIRRMGVICAEVCDATCGMLSEQSPQNVHGIKVRLEWCRSICLDCALAFDGAPGAEPAAAACRACAVACADFMTSLD